MWNDISDFVIELYERNLDNILSVLRTDAGRRGLVYRHIGNICGPKKDPGEWIGPFPPQKKTITDISELCTIDAF